MNRKKILIAAICIIAVCSLIAIPLLLPPANPPDPLQNAINKAIDFFEDSQEPYALLWLDVMYRRFGIDEFSDASHRYDALAEQPYASPLLRVFRRITHHDNQLQSSDLAAVYVNVDRLTVPALYCDQTALPDNYSAMLNEAAQNGEYMLTHALLALIWIQENGCTAPVSDNFTEAIYNANAALIGDDTVVTDLELEAAAFLYLAGQRTLVNDAFVNRVIAVQNNDGGWLTSSDTSGDSNWHATILGLFILLHMEYPADWYPPMLAPAFP